MPSGQGPTDEAYQAFQQKLHSVHIQLNHLHHDRKSARAEAACSMLQVCLVLLLTSMLMHMSSLLALPVPLTLVKLYMGSRSLVLAGCHFLCHVHTTYQLHCAPW